MNHKVIKNASWIIACRVVQSVLMLIVSMLTARYLGPSNFGLISYAASVVAFVTPLMQLGLSNILVQETVQNPGQEGRIFGTAVVMSLCSSAVCILGVVSFAFIANGGQRQTVTVCALYSLVLVFQAVELIQYWFQAKYLSKYFSVVSLCTYGAVSAYKIWLLASGKSVVWFAVSTALDAMLIDGALLVIYRRLGGQKLCFDWNTAKRMFSRSKYYIVSGMMVTVFAQTDKIMLTLMIGETANGFYSAAVSCAGMTSFVFVAIIDSMRPAIFESRNQPGDGFQKNMTLLYSIIIFLALGQSLGMTVLAKPIIYILYGADYAPAVTALGIVVWYTTFSYMGAVRNIWILANEQQRYLWVINLSGASANVVLNALLIPHWGVNGAAVASLVTQIFTNFVLGFLLRPIRANNALILKAMDVRMVIRSVKQFVCKK